MQRHAHTCSCTHLYTDMHTQTCTHRHTPCTHTQTYTQRHTHTHTSLHIHSPTATVSCHQETPELLWHPPFPRLSLGTTLPPQLPAPSSAPYSTWLASPQNPPQAGNRRPNTTPGFCLERKRPSHLPSDLNCPDTRHPPSGLGQTRERLLGHPWSPCTLTSPS